MPPGVSNYYETSSWCSPGESQSLGVQQHIFYRMWLCSDSNTTNTALKSVCVSVWSTEKQAGLSFGCCNQKHRASFLKVMQIFIKSTNLRWCPLCARQTLFYVWGIQQLAKCITVPTSMRLTFLCYRVVFLRSSSGKNSLLKFWCNIHKAIDEENVFLPSCNGLDPGLYN